MQTNWTPVPFNLLAGNPFSYSPRSISAISATEAFITGIDSRDNGRCVVCGTGPTVLLEHAHIVARVEHETVRPFFPSRHNLTIQNLDTVGGDARQRLHSYSGEVCCTRGKEWRVDVQKPPWAV